MMKGRMDKKTAFSVGRISAAVLSLLLLLSCPALPLGAQSRFPRPDFESGYQYPELSYAVPSETVWGWIDVSVLLLLLCVMTWAVHRKRTRTPIIISSALSVGYFGFFRGGCVCSIGSVQNVALALVDPGYHLPIYVLLFFLLPLVFALFFGRVFCGGVCPFGALQDLVNVKNLRISRPLAKALGVIPWIYLSFTLIYALTRSQFLICRFDPFIGIFRLGGDFGLIVFGVALLILAVFTGRPFCRFLCPYGALLSLVSAVSVKKITITPHKCVNCQLCHSSCPVDALRPPYGNTGREESRTSSVGRVLLYALLIPLLTVGCAFLLRSWAPQMSLANKEVHLLKLVTYSEQHPDGTPTPEVEAFYAQGRTKEELQRSVDKVHSDFRLYGFWGGALIGLVIGLTLLSLTTRRKRPDYEIAQRECVACGRCFRYCPQNMAAAAKPVGSASVPSSTDTSSTPESPSQSI